MTSASAVAREGSLSKTLVEAGATTTEGEPRRHSEKSYAEYFGEVVELVKVFCVEGNVRSVSVSEAQEGTCAAASVECYAEDSNQDSTE